MPERNPLDDQRRDAERYARLVQRREQPDAALRPEEYDEFDAWAGRPRPVTPGTLFQPLR